MGMITQACQSFGDHPGYLIHTSQPKNYTIQGFQDFRSDFIAAFQAFDVLTARETSATVIVFSSPSVSPAYLMVGKWLDSEGYSRHCRLRHHFGLESSLYPKFFQDCIVDFSPWGLRIFVPQRIENAKKMRLCGSRTVSAQLNSVRTTTLSRRDASNTQEIPFGFLSQLVFFSWKGTCWSVSNH